MVLTKIDDHPRGPPRRDVGVDMLSNRRSVIEHL